MQTLPQLTSCAHRNFFNIYHIWNGLILKYVKSLMLTLRLLSVGKQLFESNCSNRRKGE